MSFTSLEFCLFFPIVLALRPLARRASAEKGLLLVASYLFYLSSGLYGVLLVVITSVVDFQVGRRMAPVEDATVRRRWLFVSLVANLGVLGFFKYSNFLSDNIRLAFAALGVQLAAPHYDLILPIGISYFTFSGISYVLDVYYERIEPCRDASEYLLYVAYFPKILAGPIVRAQELLPQLRERPRATATDIEVGASYFLLGAVKKLVIADQLAAHVGMIFDAPAQYDAATLLQGLVGYTVQIYCDFSGYSDMAIGCARIMGIRFPENFLMPYSAVSITEFWRRWHITLSNWFRDYVFLPLEFASRGNRNATLRKSLNVMTTMLLCGLWHGASWNFVFWGGLHGAALAVQQAWRAWRPITPDSKRPYWLRTAATLSSRALTLSVVMLGWIFFRAKSWSIAMDYLHGLTTWRGGTALGSVYILPLSALVLLAHLIVGKDRNWALQIPEWPAPVRVAIYSTIVLVLSLLVPTDAVPFVYFQF
jgi:alginate O-acetyltransferase complex protein AlgI